MKFLHENGDIAPDDLITGQPRELLNEVNRALSNAIPQGVENANVKYGIPEETLNALRENVFVFSGMKTYHELKEASQMLLTETGEIKSFEKFNQDVQKIYGSYNQRYLEAEYGFAVHSAQIAAKWNDYAQDGDEYNLQYRTAGDDRVRADHAALNGITLSLSDEFWNSCTPPLDWGCRCTLIQVLKDKYPLSDSAEAQQLGKAATTRLAPDGTNRLAMFRNNPGKTLRLFPDKHPYFPRGCSDCPKNLQLAANIDKNELCRVCIIARKIAEKSKTAREREKYLLEMKPLLKTAVTKEAGGKKIKVKFTRRGNKHLYADTLTRAKGLLNKNDLKSLNAALKNADFVKSSEITKPRKDSIRKFYYFKDKNKELYYNVAEEIKVESGGRDKGKNIKFYYLYSITKSVK
jgi:SPP1 gp7 family putative phage head morphogenesis protein